jgi:hypothetical protein
MNISEHSRIIYAYLARMKTKDLEAILEADKKCWLASQNNGIIEQIKRQNEFMGVVLDAMGNMMAHDKDIITKIVTDIVNREVTA